MISPVALFAPSRRRVLLAAAAATLGPGSRATAQQRLAVTLRKFEIMPAELVVIEGQAVVLTLTALDFIHGFAIPELGLRADVPIGRSMELPVPAARPGRYTMLCDNFCGDGHDRMMGWLVVQPRPN